MALVVLGKEQPVFPVEILHPALELAFDQVLLKEFLLEPQGHRHSEGSEPARREGKVRLEQPLELEKRLIIESNVGDLIETACLGQAILDGIAGKTGVLFLAREALFLRGGGDVAINDERSRAVVVKRGNPENAHRGRLSRARGRERSRRPAPAL